MDAVTDLYPSRQSSAAAVAPRKDPVVYGGAVRSDGLLPETLEKYRQDGFLRFDSFLDAAALAVLTREMERLRAEEGGAIRSIDDAHRRSAAVDALARDPALLGPVRQILGGPVYLHRSRFDVPGQAVASPFYWHSDFATWHAEDGMPRMRAVNVEISLSDATAENGPLMLIPGSHLHYVPRLGDVPEADCKISFGQPDAAGLVQLIERNGIYTATGTAGTMMLFDCNLLHGSNGNITPLSRASLCLSYNSVDNRPPALDTVEEL
jgi:ectoine hydroxylase